MLVCKTFNQNSIENPVCIRSIFLVLLGLFLEFQRDMYKRSGYLSPPSKISKRFVWSKYLLPLPPFPKFQRDVYEMGIFLPPTHLIFPKSQRDLYEAGIFLFPPPTPPLSKIAEICRKWVSFSSLFLFFVCWGEGRNFCICTFFVGGGGGRSFFNLHYARKLFIVLYQNSLTYYPINSTALWFDKLNNNTG